MKKVIALALLIGLVSCSTSVHVTQKNEQKTNEVSEKVWNYEIENMGVGSYGVYMVKVTDYFKSPHEPYLDKLKADAVHSIIYQGIPAGNGSIKQPALLQDKNKIEGGEAYLESFFSQDSNAAKYINSVAQGSTQIVKIKNNRQFRISVVLSVSKDKLNNDLIKANVIKPLDNIFR